MENTPGILYIVATPIGNLNDISFRALETLNKCDLIACEDTRHTKRLCQHHDIRTPLQAYHQHNEHQAGQKLIDRLNCGEHIALVSDAGTPLISDPGYVVVQLAHQAGIQVSPIPGPSALISLLSVAGLDTSSIQFEGFLPNKSSQRLSALKQLLPCQSTLVIYESSHRILACLNDISNIAGSDHLMAMGRELTKTFETIYHGSIDQVLTQLTDNPVQQKGEFVIAISATKPTVNESVPLIAQKLALTLMPLLPPKIVSKIVGSHHDCNKKQVYQFILDQQASE
ncbi:16S rRNA (cytidine(1402)-2'-O)-methyltransferase [Marinicella rhabdoformis]|uniref:16S rRNA (cytidine(1402)-2'-O)-methyltransferase n=1 Tax=Marinicella rhabdoformis TaxID=2580566 RepID=UPI0012AEC98A|nr:16S rRNA (cytidine(1402)-2'-O)-methyltransferase [Marinicella rhabdoformis]